MYSNPDFYLSFSTSVHVLHMLLLTSEALIQWWWLAKYHWYPVSTNQQSFYRDGSDSYPGNLNLTLLHIIIWGLNPPKRYLILCWNKDGNKDGCLITK